MLKKLLYIAPHLSTGGLPQYLVKKIELIKNDYEIYVIEYSDHGGNKLVVQKNKILKLIDSNKFYTLGEDKSEIHDLIEKISPDIIHLEEIPEYFMNYEIAEKIYNINRKYSIVETSHDSSFNTDNKLHFPDKFMFVSNWQIQQYKDIDIPKVLVEYPIEYNKRPDRTEALKKLNLDPSKIHILHVGLFTPRKNQAEFFEYARMLPDYQFHCVGNQAGNFAYYWKPLMEDVPDNITWWDERKDVDNFYSSMDLFLFTSRGSDQDKETMPLVIREAMSWHMNIMIYNLGVYLNYFDKYDNIQYLDFDSLENNKNLIKETVEPTTKEFIDGIPVIELDESALQYSSIMKTEDVFGGEKTSFIVSTYPTSEAIINTTKECLERLRNTIKGVNIILTSHAPIPIELQELADYCIYDNNNILTKHTYYSNMYSNSSLHDVFINLKKENNNIYHGPAVYTNYYNGVNLSYELGIKNTFFLNFDYHIKDSEYIETIKSILKNNNAYFGELEAKEGKCLQTFFLGANTKYLYDILPKISDDISYDKLMNQYGAESNGLENIFYHLFKTEKNIYREKQDIFDYNIVKSFDHQDFSRSEYFTILPTNLKNYFCPYVHISNARESKIIHYTVEKNGIEVINRPLGVKGKFHFWDLVNHNVNDNIIVTFQVNDLTDNSPLMNYTYNLNQNYFDKNIKNNGSFTWKGGDEENYPLSRIKLMHLVTEPNTNQKEITSALSLQKFCNNTGIKYEQRINKIWKERPPLDTCNRPNDIDDKPGHMKLSPGHYGCYLAHKNAILEDNNKDYDFVLIFEGDVVIDYDHNELYNSLLRWNDIARKNNLDIIGFGNPIPQNITNTIEDVHISNNAFVPAQSYLIPHTNLKRVKEITQNSKWDAFDLWIKNVAKFNVATADKIYTKHIPGFSIVDQKHKDRNNDNPQIFQ